METVITNSRIMISTIYGKMKPQCVSYYSTLYFRVKLTIFASIPVFLLIVLSITAFCVIYIVSIVTFDKIITKQPML